VSSSRQIPSTDDAPTGTARRRSPDTRQELVRAALDIISERGIDALKIDEVAATVGVTKGSIYWHFADRGALVQAALAMHIDDLLAETLEGIQDAIEQATDTSDYLSRLAPFLLDPYDKDIAEHRWQRLEMLCAIRRDPELWEQIQQLHARSLARFTELMREAQTAGFLRAEIDAQAIATMIQMISLGSVWIDLLGADAPSPEAIQGVMLFLVSTLFPDGPPAGT